MESPQSTQYQMALDRWETQTWFLLYEKHGCSTSKLQAAPIRMCLTLPVGINSSLGSVVLRVTSQQFHHDFWSSITKKKYCFRNFRISYCHPFTQKYLLCAKYYADDKYNGAPETWSLSLWEKSCNFPSGRKDQKLRKNYKCYDGNHKTNKQQRNSNRYAKSKEKGIQVDHWRKPTNHERTRTRENL